MPPFRQLVTITTPAATVLDPITGNELAAGPASVQSRAFIAQDNTASVGRGIEKSAEQDTTISIYTMLFPPGTPVTEKSRIIDDQGLVYQVIGRPAARSGLATGTAFIACQARLISDLQGVN